ncbi:MAG: hypothetical protein AAF841_01870 [Pseudomonadota bacterium]
MSEYWDQIVGFVAADPDLWFCLGVVLAILSIPSLLSAWSDGRTPRASAITVLLAGGMIALAMISKPSGYELAEIPNVFAEVIGRYIR